MVWVENGNPTDSSLQITIRGKLKSCENRGYAAANMSYQNFQKPNENTTPYLCVVCHTVMLVPKKQIHPPVRFLVPALGSEYVVDEKAKLN